MFELGKKSGASGTEVGEEKISASRKSMDAKLTQCVGEGVASSLDSIHVAADGFAIAKSGFGGDQRGEIYREWRHGAANEGERFSCGDDSAEARSGETRGVR